MSALLPNSQKVLLDSHSLSAKMELLASGIKSQQNGMVYFCPPYPTQHVIYFQGDTQVAMMAYSLNRFLLHGYLYGLDALFLSVHRT